MNKDWKKCVYSDSSIPAAATFFPMSAIVKPMLEDRAYRKAGMPDYQNVETIAAILTCECYNEILWFVQYCAMQIRFYSRRTLRVWVAHAYAIHKLEKKILQDKNVF